MSAPGLDRRRISRELTRLANASVPEILGWLSTSTTETGARRIGITGPPGVGKSSLIARLAAMRAVVGSTIGIVSVDPSSPLTGGAILGDRIRMEELTDYQNIFIRSLGSRASRDGLADNLPVILEFLDRSGFTELVVETVGVGQVGCEVKSIVDTVVLVMMPGSGDQIQAMKSGALETADIILVNKADQPGAQQMVAQLKSVIERKSRTPAGWSIPVLSISAADAHSLAGLSNTIDAHQQWLRESGGCPAAATERLHYHLMSLILRQLYHIVPRVAASGPGTPIGELYDQVVLQLGRHP
jgi:LAO/AO transport system kinase